VLAHDLFFQLLSLGVFSCLTELLGFAIIIVRLVGRAVHLWRLDKNLGALYRLSRLRKPYRRLHLAHAVLARLSRHLAVDAFDWHLTIEILEYLISGLLVWNCHLCARDIADLARLDVLTVRLVDGAIQIFGAHRFQFGSRNTFGGRGYRVTENRLQLLGALRQIRRTCCLVVQDWLGFTRRGGWLFHGSTWNIPWNSFTSTARTASAARPSAVTTIPWNSFTSTARTASAA
jgi:hypothetical protein